jgi:hypothetical protein
MNLQAQCDLATEYDRIGERIAREITPPRKMSLIGGR